MTTLDTIAGLRISLASPEQIRSWSSGEVTRPDTIHYLTRQPEKGGLFCERIFGPVHDWMCACHKYKHERTPGFVCERCGVEVGPSRVRRERMGHIGLAAPVAHSWFARGTPSLLARLLDLSRRQLRAILGYTGYLVTSLDEQQRQEALAGLDEENETERPWHLLLKALAIGDFLEETQYREMALWCGASFRAQTGASALQELLKALDLDHLAAHLRQDICCGRGNQKKAIKRLQVVEAFRKGGLDPAWMVLEVLPVLPPDLRPLVPLDGNRFAISDLNHLYARVLYRNARLRRFMAHDAPEVFLNYERCLLQEACDALFENARNEHPLLGARGMPLRSLTDELKGKQGRFRRNLLGKRVDYSGRSVICVGTDLRLHECGLPKKVALELFKPFVVGKLVDRKAARTPRQAKRMVERRDPRVWDVLAECLHEKVVLLNRAPTLHRLSIQAFEAKLVEGDAIRLHPLVCSAFNADFDGDQMAVHLPLSDEAQAEARHLLLSTRNLRSPASGEPSISLSQEIALGCFYLTQDRPTQKQAGRVFTDAGEAQLAYEHGIIDLHTPLMVRLPVRQIYHAPAPAENISRRGRIETTVGRLIFNEVLPDCLRYRNYAMTKECLKQLVAESLATCGEEETARLCDALKQLGYRYATKSGVSFAMSDIKEPPEKHTLVASGQARAEEIQQAYQEGIITEEERDQRSIALWTDITEHISQQLQASLDPWGALSTIIQSGATKARFQQIRQLSGIRGLMASPSGRILPIPVLGNYLRGLQTWEVFIAGSGARKGFMDRSLNTAQSGYLTRKLVEVGMGVWTTMEDCGTEDGLLITQEQSQSVGYVDMGSRLPGRILAEPVADLDAGVLLDEALVNHLLAQGCTAVRVRSPLTCRAPYGICCRCYGWDLSTRKPVKQGVAVGVIAGQSIGEPGTQLTMRTFHSGGIANAQGDITQGLPRVSELFEGRVPAGAAILAAIEGRVQVEKQSGVGGTLLRLLPCLNGTDERAESRETSYTILPGQAVLVEDGEAIEIGTRLSGGPLNPRHLLELQGREATARYLVSEVQKVYRGTGVYINDKHVEVTVRQMLRYVRVADGGDTDLLPGEILDGFLFEAFNMQILAQGGQPALARPVLLGVTKAALQTESWVAAASFQETSRVLTRAAIQRQIDPLRGYKERVIVGTRIPTWIR